MAWPSIYTPKKPHRVVAVRMTDAGRKAFEAARAYLVKLSGHKVVSDSDVIEHLALGDVETRKRLGK